MDPVTAGILIRSAGEVAVALVGLLKASGRTDIAGEIEAILKRSDDTWKRVLDRANKT